MKNNSFLFVWMFNQNVSCDPEVNGTIKQSANTNLIGYVKTSLVTELLHPVI